MYGGWGDYVSTAERRRQALREVEKLRQKGRPVAPVVIEGRAIANTFWGKAWCDNLERYSDYENRLPRGRSYVRNGSVLDLQVAAGKVEALVSGTRLYTVTLKVSPVTKVRWQSICADCAGAIDSLVELLQGHLSTNVMERICRQQTGLFPSPKEIELLCSCPDWADMCKHVAAVLYGVGTRLDKQPELLFRLHGVDEKELIAKAGKKLSLSKRQPAASKMLGGDADLSALFALDMAQDEIPKAKSAGRMALKAKGAAKKAAKKKASKGTEKKPPAKRAQANVKATGPAKRGRPMREAKL
jgi:uncharacterized Zn finger protein